MGYWDNIDTRLINYQQIVAMNEEQTCDLEEGLLNNNYRTYSKQHIAIISMLLQCISDIITKYTLIYSNNNNKYMVNSNISIINHTNSTDTILILNTNIVSNIIQFIFITSLCNSVCYSLIIYIIKKPFVVDIELEERISFFKVGIIGGINNIVYLNTIISAPNIGYGKTTLLIEKFFINMYNINNFNDYKLISCLLIFIGSVPLLPNYILL